jgi:enoyl-[acyl-carrier protein] reductase I
MPQISGLVQGKPGVILGVANNRSIASGIAKACHAVSPAKCITSIPAIMASA